MKKKVIRLTETDLGNLVKKIIKETSIKFNDDNPSAKEIFNHIIDLTGDNINEEIFDIINENGWSIPEDTEEVAYMLVNVILSTYELPYDDGLLDMYRGDLMGMFKNLINSEKDMYQ
tara:strand:- start:1714 stop:2064 length:351 start_codon:yes stop_codon:yes gene_type:complete